MTPNPSTDSPLSAEEVESIRKRHMFVSRAKVAGVDRCAECHPDLPWPCDAARLLATLDHERRMADAEVAALREYVAHPESRPDPEPWMTDPDAAGPFRGIDQPHFPGDFGECYECGELYPCPTSRRAASPVPTDRPEPCDRLHWTEVVEQSKAADRPEPIDEERLARALITLRGDYPGVQFDAEAIAAAYRTEPGETR